MISSRTFWALKRREQQRTPTRRPRHVGALVRRSRPEDRPDHTDIVPHATPETASVEAQGVLAADVEDVLEPTTDERSYREVQAEAKDLGIPANQTREDLLRAIENATS